jgi:hypothetical protein
MQHAARYPRWQFVCETDQTWTWRAMRTVSAAFVRQGPLGNAARCGFDPLGCYWTVTVNDHDTTDPGKPPISLPDGTLLPAVMPAAAQPVMVATHIRHPGQDTSPAPPPSRSTSRHRWPRPGKQGSRPCRRFYAGRQVQSV